MVSTPVPALEVFRKSVAPAFLVKVPVVKRHLSPELGLINAQAGWSAVGGPLNAGAGVRIAIIFQRNVG